MEYFEEYPKITNVKLKEICGKIKKATIQYQDDNKEREYEFLLMDNYMLAKSSSPNAKFMFDFKEEVNFSTKYLEMSGFGFFSYLLEEFRENATVFNVKRTNEDFTRSYIKNLENGKSLFMLYNKLMNIDMEDYGPYIDIRETQNIILNSKTYPDMMDKLLREKHGDIYNLFIKEFIGLNFSEAYSQTLMAFHDVIKYIYKNKEILDYYKNI